MAKTQLMLRVEGKIGEPLEDFLRREYETKRISSHQIARQLGIGGTAAVNWLRGFGIEIRDGSDSQLPAGVAKLSKEQLKQLYEVERKTVKQIAKELGTSTKPIIRLLNSYGIDIRIGGKAYDVPSQRPPKKQLKRWYVTEKMSSGEIAKMFEVTDTTVLRWLRESGIERRSGTESMIPEIAKPSKTYLETAYNKQKKSASKIGKEIGVSESAVFSWLRSYGIKIRKMEESKLPPGVTKPTKEQMEQAYTVERKTITEVAEEFGIGVTTAHRWLKAYGIAVRDNSEALLPQGVKRPTKEQIERLLAQGMSTRKIAKKFEVGYTTANGWLRFYKITRPNSNEQFMSLLQGDPIARNLAAAAVVLNGQGYDIEKIITEVYEGRFKDQEELHQLLQDNAKRIYELINEGVTNLGEYIGEFTFADRRIVPVLLGQALMSVPDERITQSLEERLVRILRLSYSPRFNEDPQSVLAEIKEKIESSPGKVRTLYERLGEHYRKTMELSGELR